MFQLNILQFAGSEDWWGDIIRYANKYGMDDILIERVKDDLEENAEAGMQTMSRKYEETFLNSCKPFHGSTCRLLDLKR